MTFLNYQLLTFLIQKKSFHKLTDKSKENVLTTYSVINNDIINNKVEEINIIENFQKIFNFFDTNLDV